MDRCASCGAALTPGLTWCGQCFAPTATPATAGASAGLVAAPAGSVFAPTRQAPVETAPALMRSSRWLKTPTTFGPTGRLVATFALLVPLVVMIVGGMVDMFALGGALIWLVVVMPLALRDIWKPGKVRVG